MIDRAVRMVRDGVVRATDGRDIPLRVDTICTHGDTPGIARADPAAARRARRPKASRSRHPTRRQRVTHDDAPIHRSEGAGLFGWWREGTPEGRRALIAAALGWMLDSFDVMLYALVLAVDHARPRAVEGDGRRPRIDHAARGGRRRHRLRRDRRSLRPHARADGERPDLLGVHRRVRAGPDRGAAGGVPGPARHRHGRRVGERRGAGLGDLAGRASRQGARPDAERLGDRLRVGGRW